MSKVDMSKINRVFDFLSMCLAGMEIDCSTLKKGLNPDDIMFNYMANGASDSLTVQNIKDFQEEVSKLNAEV